VPADMTAVGTPIEIEIRGRKEQGHVVPEPFYKRPRKPT
jgi:glycine cleavage system aminomethyltransferase T